MPTPAPPDPPRIPAEDSDALVPVPASAIPRRGRRLKVIREKPLAAVMDLAVSRVLRRRLKRYDPKTVEAVQNEIAREFQALLKENSRSVRGMSKQKFMAELERSRNEILRSRDEAQAKLDEMLKKLDFFSSIQELDDRAQERGAKSFEEVHRHTLAARIQDLLASADRGEITPAELQHLLVTLASQSVADDRRRIQEERTSEYHNLSDTFERRIAKLNRALADSEQALLQLSRQKNGETGLASIYRTVQGLSEAEENRLAKKAILEQIFLANLTLQKKTA